MTQEFKSIRNAVKRPEFYDGEKLWIEYHKMGRAATNGRLRNWAKANGMYNPKKGRPSQMGPHFAMWRWALRNPEKAWPYFKEWAEQYEDELISQGIEINFKNFLKEIRNRTASGAVGHGTWEEFCEKYELEKEVPTPLEESKVE